MPHHFRFVTCDARASSYPTHVIVIFERVRHVTIGAATNRIYLDKTFYALLGAASYFGQVAHRVVRFIITKRKLNFSNFD
jgi:Uri superfamily endonuclease